MAHGVMMGLIWVILFPLGAIIIRFLGGSMKNAVGRHRIVQISSLVLLLIATGIGVYLAWGHQFSAFRAPTMLPVTDNRPLLWVWNRSSGKTSSWIRSIPPRSLRQRPSHTPSLVHQRPPLARPHSHHLRSGELWLRSPHCKPTIQRCIDMVDW